MADEAREDEGGGADGKVVAYKLMSALGDNAAGTVIHVPEKVGDELVKAGLAELATEGDLGGDVEGDPVDQPMVANAISRLNKKVEKAVAETVARAVASRPDHRPQTVPAQVKAAPYRSNGEYIKGIMKAVAKGDQTEANKVMAYQEEAAIQCKKMGMTDVVIKAPLGINETTGSQGGYLVNPVFSPDVYVAPHGQIDLQSQIETIPATGNVYNQRYVNESSLANGSIFGGLNMTAVAEGNAFTPSLPAWNNVAFTLQKLAIFSYFTMEVLQDNSYNIEGELDEMVDKAFVIGINTQIIQGSTLEGALNAPSCVTVAKSANDTAFSTTPGTNLTYADVAQIWASVYPDCQVSPKGMWLFHPSLAAPLNQMTYTFSGSAPAWGITYNAQQGRQGAGWDTPYLLFGKPAYPCWACSAPGAAGDIMYVDFGTFRNYKKPFRVEVSKEFQFGTDQVAVRFVSRLDCKTVFRNRITGPTGAQQFSNIVTRAGTGT